MKRKIGLISDTHGYMDERIEHHLGMCDEIWHAGDVGDPTVLDRLERLAPLRGVYGNIDGTAVRKRFPEIEKMDFDGLKIAMIHIAGPLGRYTPQTRALIQDFKPDVLVCGHSHILRVKRDEKLNLLYINPGAAGRHGFHKMRTLCRFDIHDGKLEHFEAIELGPRSTQSIH
ncbi:MAG: metallophosphoesterase family protein [Cryomorphaceae bacterium]